MTRATCAVVRRKRHRKIVKLAKGYYGRRKSCYRLAKQSVERAWQQSYIGRKLRKRDLRRLWIIRINAAARQCGMTYSEFMYGLKKASLDLNRKSLSEIAVRDLGSFSMIAEIIKDPGCELPSFPDAAYEDVVPKTKSGSGRKKSAKKVATDVSEENLDEAGDKVQGVAFAADGSGAPGIEAVVSAPNPASEHKDEKVSGAKEGTGESVGKSTQDENVAEFKRSSEEGAESGDGSSSSGKLDHDEVKSAGTSSTDELSRLEEKDAGAAEGSSEDRAESGGGSSSSEKLDHDEVKSAGTSSTDERSRLEEKDAGAAEGSSEDRAESGGGSSSSEKLDHDEVKSAGTSSTDELSPLEEKNSGAAEKSPDPVNQEEGDISTSAEKDDES